MQTSPKLHIETAAAAQPRILIVDDIADNRTILARRFVRRGFDIVEAEDGPTALKLIATEHFDVVLLDVMMPGMDGTEVLVRIREDWSPVELPVIMVTAKSQSEDIVNALDLKANDYVTKPVDFNIALARVNVQIERKRAAEEVKRANKALLSANELLELKVSERTASLLEINSKLKTEMEQRLDSEQRTRYLAYHDALTGLANRTLFREELELARTQSDGSATSVAVLFLDLDGFKSVNDTLGHSVGDQLLKELASEFRNALADGDRIARLGGDEFAILHLTPNPQDSTATLADTMIKIASRERCIDGNLINVGVSIGVVIASGLSPDTEELLKNADLAMYRAKAAGRGTFRVFDPEMDARAQARRVLELDLRYALNHGEFELYYQPLMSLNNNKVCSFEALLRWNHNKRGSVPPDEFISVAEEMGMIVQLGDWVLRQACLEACAWPDHIRVAVNISPIQFLRGNVLGSVVGALASSGLPANRLEVEITESVLLERTEKNIETLNQLRELGVRISMDDFGTGYSSLGYLRKFQFDKIKIDQSFIKDMTDNLESGAIVDAITNLGASFGISTTAEGVETSDQLAYLIKNGCTEAQGWIISKPIPASEIAEVLAMIALR